MNEIKTKSNPRARVTLLPGIEQIAEERKRQIETEGWTPEHDDEHDRGELALAAVCFTAPDQVFVQNESGPDNSITFRDPWPRKWGKGWDKRVKTLGVLARPENCSIWLRISLLVKAGALIAAEIDRLIRLVQRDGKTYE